MQERSIFSVVVFLCLCLNSLHAQVSPSFTQFFINPYRINPSYAGIEGRPVLFLAHRQQWTGIEGAPATTTFSFHAPLDFGVNVGLDLYNDSRSILNTNSFMLTAGYVIAFSKKDFLRFGLSGGLGFRNIDLNQVDNPSDPALLNAVENNLFLNGNFGISFQTGYLTVGVAMPNLFEPNLNNTSTFENGRIAPLNEIVGHASYRFYLALDEVAFEPHVMYRYSEIYPHQYEAAGIFHIKNAIWLGGSYRQDYGVSALGGIKIKNRMIIGYSYGLGISQLPGIGKSTHEFNLSIQLGRKRRSRSKVQNVYISFIDTERVYWDLGRQRQRITGRTATTANMYRPPTRTGNATTANNTNETNEDNANTETGRSHVNPRLSMTREMGNRAATGVRTETVNAGPHPLELGSGNYIIVREFESEDTASGYAEQLTEEGQRAGFGFVSPRSKWVVYAYRSDSRFGLNRQAEKLKADPEYTDVWILVVK